MWRCLRAMTSWTGETTPIVNGCLTSPPAHPTPPHPLSRLEGLTGLHLHSAPWQAGAPPTAPPTLCNLGTKLHRSSGTQGHYTAAYEFCKISGLLCSYGNLVQEVRDSILATFCRGPTCSFSVQVVVQDSQGSRESGVWGHSRVQ